MAQERSRYEEILASNAEDQAAYAQLRTLKKPSGKPSRKNALFANQKTVIMRLMKLFSVMVAVFLFAVLWMTLYPHSINDRLLDVFGSDYFTYMNLATWVLYAILILWFGKLYHAYEAGITRVSELVYSQTLANFLSGAVIYILVSLSRHYAVNPLPLISILLAQTAWSIVWSIAANKLYFRLNPPQKTAIIYKEASDLRKIEQIRFFSSRFDVQNHIENPNDIKAIIREMDGSKAIFVAGIDSSLRDEIVKYCLNEGVQCYVAPQVCDVVMAGAEHMQAFCTPILRVQCASPSPWYLFMKRAIDIIGSLFGIVVTSPFMLLTAIAIKVYDGGPVFYKQVRLTQGRRRFSILKFRSMRVDAEKDGVARLAKADDDRITPIGRIIRAIRFDELPQLFNILRGDMTIVGPRPERPEIAKQYEEALPSFSLRLQVKAGLTGYAQVYGRYNTEPEDKLQMDLMYINNMSTFEDIRLILATIKVLLIRESTSGVSNSQTTAAVQKPKKSA